MKVINIMKAKLMRQRIGIKVRGETISTISFTDPIVIIIENEGDTASYRRNERDASNIQNENKTKILVCAKKP